MGVAVLAVSPAGLDASDVIGWLALAIGTVSGCALILGQVEPVPFLFSITALVGAVAPIVDAPVAMALNVIVVSVLATGALLVRSLAGFWSLAALSLAAVAARPVLGLMGWESDLALSVPPSVAWIIATTAVIATALGFRSLRDQLVRRDIQQRDMNRLISSLAHHLRTPLTAVIGFGHLIAGEVGTETGHEYARRIVDHGWELSSSLDDLIIAARADANGLEMRRQPIDLRGLVEEVVSSQPGALEKLSACSVTGTAIGDPARARQILAHLVSNAVLHGGPVMSISTRTASGQVTVYVSDNGPPLEEAALERAFEPFHSESKVAQSLRRGIGLTVARILARAMGGEVELVSDHTGVTARFRLPADPQHSVTIDTAASLNGLRHSALWRASSDR